MINPPRLQREPEFRSYLGELSYVGVGLWGLADRSDSSKVHDSSDVANAPEIWRTSSTDEANEYKRQVKR